MALCFAAPGAYANPTGATVVNGSASFASSGSKLTVTNTPGAIINWQQFSIGQNEVTRFIQQNAASAVLNRVIGGNPSAILGTLTSNGRVYLINASGIAIGRGAMIDVAGFAASTLNLSNADFIAGRNLFQGTGSEGHLLNAGTIRTAEGGHVYLVAPKVENQKDAVITSPKGEILVAAGRTVELVNARTPDVRVEFTAPGEAVNAGEIVAASGHIGIFGMLVKNSGLVSASRAVAGEGGKIVFQSAGDVLLEAGSRVEATGDKGGSVQVLGERVGVLDGAGIDVSGDAGGGTVLVGGDFQGRNSQVRNAWRTYFGAGASIKADAIAGGDGGKVIVWADDITRAYGEISARGGAAGGNGGFVEVSGKNQLDFAASVNASAPHGLAGTLLLDPTNITVANGGGATTAQVDAFADAGGTLTISPATLNAAGTTVVLQASNDININNTVNLTTAGAGFVAQAGDDIVVSAAITTNGGRIHLEADSPHAPGGSNGSGQLSVTANGALTSNGGPITLIGGGDPILSGGGIALTENHPIDAGAGGINVALSGNASIGVGSLGLLTQILGNPIDELHTTGALVIGTATTAGSNGLGASAQTLLADSITNIYPGSAIDLSPASGTTFTLTAGSGGILIDQPLTTFQDTTISTTGTLTINDPINTTNNNLMLTASNVVTGTNGSINTGTGACTGGGCPISTIFWDGGGDGVNWFDPLNWTGDALPTASDIVNIDSSTGTILIGASGALARSLIANRPLEISATGTLSLTEASQFADLFTLSGGSLLGTGSASVTGPGGSFVWSGGTMGAGGQFQLVSGRSGALSNSLVLNRDFLNEGLLTLSSATISGSGSFANAGTLTAAAGTTNSISNAFQNIANTIAGTIQVDGALTLSSFALNQGTIQVASAGAFSTGIFDNSGSVTVDGTATIGTLTLSAGTVGGTGDLTVGTDYNEAGGTLGTTFSDLSITKSGAFAVGSFTAVDSISLTAGAAITDANGASVNVTAPVVSLAAAGGISLDTATAALTTNNVTSGNTSIRNTGALTVNGMSSAGAVSLTSTAGITLAGDITAAGTGDTIVLAGTSFDNSADRALNTGSGRFLVWSGDPAGDDRGNLAYDFKQYDATFGSSTVLGTGDGFLYTAAPTITASLTGAVSKVYDATDVATLVGANYSFTGAIDGDAVTLNNPTSGTYDDKNVNTGKTVSVTGIAITGATDGGATVYGYQLASTSASGSVGEITAAPLTVTANDASKTYGQTTTFAGTEFASSGLVGGETIGSVTLTSAGAAAIAGVAGSPYVITPSNAAGGTFTAGNYTITYSNGSLTISRAPLTVTADDATREYGLANPAFTGTLSGLVNGDTAAVVSGLTYDSAAVAGSNVGGYAITSSGGTAANYTITTRTDGTLTITQAPLTVTADDASREYGLANPAFTGTLGGLRNGDAPSVVSGITYGSLALAGSNVGGYAITSSGGTATNYTITTRTDGTLTITQAPLTVTADDATREYGLANPAFTGSLTGLRNGDAASVVSGLSFASSAVAGSNVGGYAISSSGGTATNYIITTRTDGTLTITQAPLTVTADDASREYGLANPAFTGSLTGLRNGDAASVVSGLSYTSSAVAGSNVGGYAIGSSGGTATNYAITVRTDGTLTITQAPLTVTADDASREYGLANPAFTGSLTGLRNGDATSVVSGLTYASSAVPGSNVGGYAITSSGGTATNYAITVRSDGTLTITQAPLTVTADDATREYGLSNPTFTGTLAGLRNGDAPSVVSGLTYGSAAIANSNVGGYAIASSGGTATNYTITTRTDGTLTITPAPLTYVATPASRPEGDANPVFSGSVTGFRAGDTLNSAIVDPSQLQFLSPADTVSLAGSYAIDGSGLTALNGNYTFQQALANTTALTIIAAALPSNLNPAAPTTPTVPDGSSGPQGTVDQTLLNLNTGENVFVPPNTIPDPGIYLSQDANSVVVVGQSDLGSQMNIASTLLFPTVSPQEGTYVNSENGLLYAVDERSLLDPGVYYNREEQTVLVVTSNGDGNVSVASADIKDAVQTVASGAGGRRVVSVACR